MRTGTANSPLHYGRAPAWLFEKMAELARQVTLAAVSEFGPHEMLRRLSDPGWFQAFGCVLGFDWHSSGLTTTACGALKEGLRGLEHESGLFVCGGKGKASRKTPLEIGSHCESLSLPPEALIYASRMSAKVDSAAVQDGYTIYHHCFIFSADGSWAVVQQGMNEQNGYARRYHWLSDDLQSFVIEPHRGICAERGERLAVLDMTAGASEESRRASVELVRENPNVFLAEIKKAGSTARAGRQLTLSGFDRIGLGKEEPAGKAKCARLRLPRRHEVTVADLSSSRIGRIILSAHDRQPENFEQLLGLKGVGARTVRALSLIGELLYGASPSFEDPARFSFAHGGKDGHPYPVDRETYQASIDFLRDAVRQARINRSDRLKALRRLERFA